ncbi:MAG TPA: hypothetical protein VG101_03370 [Puia sp.]|jgi:hypothetical protein|nr:hypothetical protein [Puia sp.]
MKLPKLTDWRLLTAVLLFSVRPAIGQVIISGTVYDKTQKYTMTGVSVLTTSGLGTATDSTGHYRIRMGLEDSLYFSYLGKTTLRFPAREINPNMPFDMALAVSIDTLPAAFVRGNNYSLDSLQTRRDYARVFNYAPNYLGKVKTTGRGGVGVGLDLDMLLNGRENRRMEAFQDRLVWQEQQNYIDHHFSKAIVRRVTGLETPALDTFMVWYRPSQDFIQSCESEYHWYKYIQQWGKWFVEDWNVRHPDIPPLRKEGADSTIMNEVKDGHR